MVALDLRIQKLKTRTKVLQDFLAQIKSNTGNLESITIPQFDSQTVGSYASLDLRSDNVTFHLINVALKEISDLTDQITRLVVEAVEKASY